MLKLLDSQVKGCSRCDISRNGKLIPFWSPYSRYAIIGESPSYRETRKGLPFHGATGDIITRVLDSVGFKARDFLILNTVQCKAASGTLNSKPNEIHINNCQNFIRKYLKVVNPNKILCLGNYGKYIFTKNLQGVLRQRGEFKKFKLDGSETEYPVLFTIHPAYCLFNEQEGLPMLTEDIQLFKDTKFERTSDWLFDENDFLI